jgi:DNA polymerase-1
MNIPARTDLGGLIRLGFVAGEGNKIVSNDFSQIELRDLAHCANATSMIEVYAVGGDIHQTTAMRAFGITDPAKVDKLKHRLPAKTLGFGLIYGMSSMGLQMTLATMGLLWDETQCQSFIDKFFSIYPEVHAYMDMQHYRARRYGMVWDLFGRIRLTPEAKSCHRWIRDAGLRQAGNLPIQSVAAGQFKLAMGKLEVRLLELETEGVHVKPLVPIHDQLMTEVEEEYAELVGEIQAEVFSGVMTDEETGEHLFRVPIESDTECMTVWKKG